MPKVAHQTMVDNIERLYRLATKEQLFAGVSWYPSALADCATLAAATGVHILQAAGVVAALSPQLRWSKNVRLAHAVIVQHQNGLPLRGHMRPHLAKCTAILAYRLTGDVAQDAAAIARLVYGKTGYKTANFYSDIVGIPFVECGGCTIDRHALGVAHGCYYGDKVPSLTRKQYIATCAPYHEVAAAHGLSASEVQAITWLVQRQLYGIND